VRKIERGKGRLGEKETMFGFDCQRIRKRDSENF
jgi:hypothetical protein